MPCKMFQWKLKGLKKGTKPAHSPAPENRTQSEVPSTSRIYEDAEWFSATGSGLSTSLAAPSDRCRSATEKKTLDTATPSESPNRVTDSYSDPAPAVLKKKSKGAAFNLKRTSVRISSHLKFSKKNKKVDATNLPATDRPSTSTFGHGHKSSHKESDAPVSSFKKTNKRLSRMFSSISNRITNITKTPNIYNEQEIKSDLPSTGKIGDDAEQQETFAEPAVLKKKSKGAAFNLKITSVRISSHLKFSKKNKKVDATNLPATDRPSTSTSGHGHKSSQKESNAPVSSFKKTKKRLSRMFSRITKSANRGIKTLQTINNEQENISDLPSTSGIPYQKKKKERHEDKEDSTATNTCTNLPASDDHPVLTCIGKSVASVEQTEHVSVTSWTKTPVINNEQETTSDLPSTNGIDEDAEQPETSAADEEATSYTSNTPELDDYPILTSIEYPVASAEHTEHVGITSTTSLSSASPTSLAAPSDGCRGASEQETLDTATVSNEQKRSELNDKWLSYQEKKKELDENKDESTTTNPSSTNLPASTFITSLTPVSLTSSPAPSASRKKVVGISFSNSKLIKTPVIFNEQETTSDLPSANGIDEDAEQPETSAVDKEATSHTSNTPELDDHPILTCIKYLVAYVEHTKHMSITSTTSLSSASPTSLAAPSDGCRGASEQETLDTATVSNEQKRSELNDRWLSYQEKKKELDENKDESTATNPSSTNLPASTFITSLTPVSLTSSPAPSASRRVYKIPYSNFNSTTGWIKTPVIYNLQENLPDLPSTSRNRDKWLLYQNKQNEINKDKKESTATHPSSTNLPASTFITSLTPVSLTSSPAPSASRKKVVGISFSNSKLIKTPVIFNEQETTSDLPSANGIDEDAEQPETSAVDKEATSHTSNTPELDDHPILTCIKYLVAYVEHAKHMSITSTTGLISVSPTSLAAPSDGCRGASEQETLAIATVSNERKQPSWNNLVQVTDLPSTSGFSDKWLPYQNMKKELDEDKEESTATNASSTNLPASTSITSLTPVSLTSLPAPSASTRKLFRIFLSNSNSVTSWIKTPVINNEQETTSDLPSANVIDEDVEQPETSAVDKEAIFNTFNTPELDDHPILTSIEYPVASAEEIEHVGNTSTTSLISVSPTSLAAPSDGCRSASEEETLPIATVSSGWKLPSWIGPLFKIFIICNRITSFQIPFLPN